MHESGVLRLLDEPLSRELEGHMSGRVARVCPGLATLLYDIDDTELALAALPKEIRLPARKKQKSPASDNRGVSFEILFCPAHLQALSPARISERLLASYS